MAGEYVFWRCENVDCGARNRIEREKIEAEVNKGRSVIFVCANCGFVNSSQPGAVFEERGPENWCACIPFEGSERRLTLGRTPDGWKDYMGRSLSEEQFTKKYQNNPRINWAWRKNGCPKAID